MEYHESYSLVAKTLLSLPFKSWENVCQALGISKPIFDKWYKSESTFRNAVDLGFINGKTEAKKILLSLSILPSSKCNTKLLTLLASDIYDIHEKRSSELNIGSFDSSSENIDGIKIVLVKPEEKEIKDN